MHIQYIYTLHPHKVTPYRVKMSCVVLSKCSIAFIHAKSQRGVGRSRLLLPLPCWSPSCCKESWARRKAYSAPGLFCFILMGMERMVRVHIDNNRCVGVWGVVGRPLFSPVLLWREGGPAAGSVDSIHMHKSIKYPHTHLPRRTPNICINKLIYTYTI